MKNILIVETADRFMPMFKKLANEYFTQSRVYVLHTSNNYFEIEEFNTKAIVKKGEFNLLSAQLSELKIDFVCIDHYISLKNIQIIEKIGRFKRVIFNIGLYCSHDKVSYSYIRYGTINWFFVGLESIRLKIKHRLFLLSVFKFERIEDFFYGDATVLFWNKFSENNFVRDYPTVKTDNIYLYEIAKKKLKNNSENINFSKVIFAPSMLGAKNKKSTEAEFVFWTNLAKVMLIANPKLHFSLSIHPLYSDKLDLFGVLDKKSKVFNEIFCGFNVESNKYDLLITDISTIYWIAPLYGLRSERVDNLFIHKKYFGENEID